MDDLVLKDTLYCKQLCQPGRIRWPGTDDEGRIERIHVNELKQAEIRFSWWKNGRLIPRPLDLAEADLLTMFQDAIDKGVFTDEFKRLLKATL
jgi:hypothetical protein